MSPELRDLVPGIGTAGFSGSGLTAFREILGEVHARGSAHLEIHLAGLPRKVGREQPYSGVVPVGDGRVDVELLRCCDVAAALALRTVLGAGEDMALLPKLYYQGDAEERRMLLRSLPFLPEGPVTVQLLEEAHRTNDEVIFASGLLDSDLPARVLDDDAFNRVVLKVAFMGLPAERLFAVLERANVTLSRVLLDFRSERQAAGRAVWAATLEVAARAPCEGVVAATVGDLWNGDDGLRLAAARAASILDDPRIGAFVSERLAVEERPEIREVLSRTSR